MQLYIHHLPQRKNAACKQGRYQDIAQDDAGQAFFRREHKRAGQVHAARHQADDYGRAGVQIELLRVGRAAQQGRDGVPGRVVAAPEDEQRHQRAGVGVDVDVREMGDERGDEHRQRGGDQKRYAAEATFVHSDAAFMRNKGTYKNASADGVKTI